MMKRYIFAAFVAALVYTPAKADLIGGNELYEWCAGKDTKENKALCKGFVMGAADHFIVSEHEQGRYSTKHKGCIPEDATPGRLVEIVVQWLEDNPHDRYFRAAAIVVTAIKEAFQCS
jgi:hypothetical protein